MAYTIDGYNQWATDNGLKPSPNAQQLLRHADLLIRDYTSRCTLSPGSARAIEDATYEQAHYWDSTNITPMAEDVQTQGKVVASSSLLGASMSYADTTTTRVENREKAATSVCFAARLVLNLAGIHPAQPEVIG